MKDPVSAVAGSKLCSLCSAFVTDLLAFDFQPQTTYPGDRWLPIGEYSVTGYFPERSWGDGFHHHESFSALEASAASGCGVCLTLHRDLSQLEKEEKDEEERKKLFEGWLGLYPFWEGARLGPNKRRGYFRAGFRQGLVGMPWGSPAIASVPLHTFKLCRRPGVAENAEGVANGLEEGLPPTPDPAYIASRAGQWTRGCAEQHPQCVEAATQRGKHPLPTRVLDLGEADITTDDGPVRLYQSRGELDNYVALSHCWGGKIPAITVKDNIETRTSGSGIDVAELPKNFRDAIVVTRALGVRYLWIDALCIIQDSAEDWFAEAARMASVYAGAHTVLSLLDASSSTVGFLGGERISLGIVDDRYAVQKTGQELYDYLEGCPLTTRGWCMQERLLAPALLHMGKERMFWECMRGFTSEDGRMVTGDSTGHVSGLFISVRIRMGRSENYDSKDWYTLIEEYTTRRFTFAKDKLPAIAGAATLFQSKSTPANPIYLAGLWRDDIGRGLLWGAHYVHVPGRKVWGYSSSDVCSELREPDKSQVDGRQRAPSWSWAALDGQIDHWALRIGSGADWYEVLDVSLDDEPGSKKDDNDDALTRPYVSGSVRLRGPLEKMLYHPPENPDGDVGHLTFAEDKGGQGDDKEASFGGCVLDLDRGTARSCWALIATRHNADRYMLLLEERADGTFKRIGFSTSYENVTHGPERFVKGEVVVT